MTVPMAKGCPSAHAGREEQEQWEGKLRLLARLIATSYLRHAGNATESGEQEKLKEEDNADQRCI